MSLPMSQLVPLKPGKHKHLYSLTYSTQRPLRQGLLAHSSTSVKDKRDYCKMTGYFRRYMKLLAVILFLSMTGR